MQVSHIPYAAGILNLVVLIAALSAMNSQLYVASRMLCSLARGGYARPRSAASAGPAYRLPRCSLLQPGLSLPP